MRGRHKRPLIANKNDEELMEFIQKALADRMEHYAKAQIEFSSERLENREEIENTAREFIELLSIPLKK